MFRGVNSLSLDAKGRMAIPSKYRDELMTVCQGQMVVVPDHIDAALKIYPLPAWEEFEDKLMSLPNIKPVVRGMQRWYSGQADEVTMDGNGRILVREAHRNYAAIDKKVCLSGQLDKFELWDEAAWTAQNEQWNAHVRSDPTSIPEELLNLRL